MNVVGCYPIVSGSNPDTSAPCRSDVVVAFQTSNLATWVRFPPSVLMPLSSNGRTLDFLSSSADSTSAGGTYQSVV